MTERKRGTPFKRMEAARLLAEGLSHKDVASQIGVSDRTIDRWAHAPDITQVQEKAREKAIRVVEESHELKYRRIVEASVGVGLNVVLSILRDPDSPNRDRLKCVELISKWYGLDAPTKHLIEVGIERELDSTLSMLQEKMSRESFDELIAALSTESIS